MKTKTWFHTGAWKEQTTLTAMYRDEYYGGVRGSAPGAGDAQAVFLPDTAYSGTTLASTDEEREAARALKGMVLRQEIYADDDTSAAAHPYSVSERCYEVRRIQPRTKDAPHAVFLAHPREELTYHYERVSNDPRVLHAMTLEVDDYGTVLKSAAIAYPRRVAGGGTEQYNLLITTSERQVVHKPDQVHWYRIGVPISSTSYQLTGVAAPSGGAVLSFDTIRNAVTGASVIAYDVAPTTGQQKRVLSKQRSYYCANTLSPTPLALGTIDSLALLHHQEQLAFTAGLISSVYNPNPPGTTTVTSTMLTTEGGYVADSGDYWAPSARPLYDATKFYQATGLLDPFGNQSAVFYDSYNLLVFEAHSTTTTTSLDNVVTVVNDYRVLQPKLLTDPNNNQTELAFDALGMVVKTAVMGKSGAGQGDTISNPTTMFEYDLWAYKNGLAAAPPVIKPVFARMRAREQHGGTPTWQDTYVYTDGSGRELLTKSQAAPAEGTSTPRWRGTGRTVFDNKGNPIKKYEPYFSTTSDYEAESGLTGVTPILRYDPLGRVIRTDFPNGTYSKVVFDAWSQATYDQNDTVDTSLWYSNRSGLPTSDPERRAADLAYAHRNTPTVTKLDTLGRAVRVVQDNGGGTLYTTTTALDITGNALSVTDARGLLPLQQKYDLLGRAIRNESAEAGVSRVLPDIGGVPVRTWNSRDVVMRTTFDAVRRPTHVYSKIGAATETLVLRTIYGEELGSSASLAANLRTRAYRAYDSAGAQTNGTFDFKGNSLQTERRLTTGYTATPDWSSIASLTSISAIETAAAALLETEVFTASSTYDALNRVVTATTPDASIATPTYNEANQLVAESVKIRGASTPTSFVSNVYYNARGQRTKIVYANNTRTEYTYDDKTFRLTRLLTTRTTDSAVLQDLRYTYDPVGNIVETKDIAQQTVYFSNTVVSPDSKYEYDALYRLTRAEGREHPAHATAQPDEVDSPLAALPHPNDLQVLKRYVEEYAYDGVGNILSMTHREIAGGTINWKRLYQYATASNKLRATSDPADTPGATYTDTPTYTDLYPHDARGNMTAMPHLAAMDWDYGDRLQHCNLGGGGNSYFTYDASGQRVRKVWLKTASLIEERIYVGGYEVWRKRLSGTLDEEKQTLHVMDDQRRVAMVETKTVAGGSTVSSPTSYLRYQLDDHLGSSRVECDGSGALLTYEEYHPYGTTAFRASSGATGFAPKRYRYTGKERDDETGLYYYGARYYPPWLGRWTAVDPSLKDGFNRYEYVRGNPITFSDPDGRQVAPVPAGGGGAPPGPSPEETYRKDMIAYEANLTRWREAGVSLEKRYKSELAGAGDERYRAEIEARHTAEKASWQSAMPVKPTEPYGMYARDENGETKSSRSLTKEGAIILVGAAIFAGALLFAWKSRRTNPAALPTIAANADAEATAIVEATPKVVEAIAETAPAVAETAPAVAETAPAIAETAPAVAEVSPTAEGVGPAAEAFIYRYHGTTGSASSKIAKGGFRDPTFFAQDFATGKHFGLEKMADTGATRGYVLRLKVPTDLAHLFGEGTEIGERLGLRFVDVPNGTGLEHLVEGENIMKLNEAIEEGRILMERFRITEH